MNTIIKLLIIVMFLIQVVILFFVDDAIARAIVSEKISAGEIGTFSEGVNFLLNKKVVYNQIALASSFFIVFLMYLLGRKK